MPVAFMLCGSQDVESLQALDRPGSAGVWRLWSGREGGKPDTAYETASIRR